MTKGLKILSKIKDLNNKKINCYKIIVDYNENVKDIPGDCRDYNKIYNQNNIFAKILSAKSPYREIYRDSEVLVIQKLDERKPLQYMVLPKEKGYVTFSDFALKSSQQKVTHIFDEVIKKVNDCIGVKSYGIEINNVYGQGVWHPHVHVKTTMDYDNRDKLPLSSSDDCKAGFEEIHSGFNNHDEF